MPNGSTLSAHARQLVHVGPHAGAHRVALRACVSVAVPLLLLWSVGHLDWSIYAAFGAFTSLYGRNHVHVSRAQMQLTLAAVLTAACTLGVLVGLSEHRAWIAVPVAALVASVASLLSDAQAWHPPGPLFPIFAFTACASIPSSPGDLGIAAAVAAASALFSVLVGNAHAFWQGWRRPERAGRTSLRCGSYAEVARRHVARNALGVLLAGTIATASGIGHPYWAMVSAVVPLASPQLSAGILRGVHRVLGTFAGLATAALLLSLDADGLWLIAMVVAMQAWAELWVGRNYAIALVGITPLALLMIHLVSPAPTGELLWDRGVETVIGVLVGVLVGLATRPRRTSL